MKDVPVEIRRSGRTWRFDRSFLESRWTCIWGQGCLGIHEQPDEASGEGCCSVGAEIDGDDEANLIAVRAVTLDPERFQHADLAAEGGVFSDDRRTNTRVVDGACVFLNRPGFAGGAGCALHLAALQDGESPIDWKPSVCWQLPVRIDWTDAGGGHEIAAVRRWSRADWGPEGEVMAWCCTEGERAYVGSERFIDAHAEELAAMVGDDVYDELVARMAEPD